MQEHGGKFTVCFQFACGEHYRACGERYREMRISVVEIRFRRILFCYCPQTGGAALRAEFLFLSFPKEKETKKKGNLRAAPLKIPLIVQSCYAQLRTVRLFFATITGRALHGKIVQSGENNAEFVPI